MINETPYRFEKQGWGSLELEIKDSRRTFFESPTNVRIPFGIKGFGESQLTCNPFYLFEWQIVQYSYVIENDCKFNPPFEIRINDRTINQSKERGNNHLLLGQFSFNDEVGETRIQIRDNSNNLIFELTTEVFPQKMDYKLDFKAMMADISEIIKNLAFDLLKDTFRKSKARPTGHSTEDEWWNILDALFGQLVINLNVIKRQPVHQIIEQRKILPVEKIRNSSYKSLDWFIKNSNYSNIKGNGIRITQDRYFSHASSIKKIVSYDTYENRFVVWAVKSTVDHLLQYSKYIKNTSKNEINYLPLVRRIKFYQSRLQGLLRENPFNEVGEFEKRTHFSTSLTRGSGYRDFLHIYLLLTKGLEIAENEIFKIGQKKVSTLYEYWCFLKLVQILKEQNASEIDYQDLIKIRANKFQVELQKGIESRVTFRKKDSTETTTIYFNREFVKDGSKVFTYNQRPDYSIEFKKVGFEKSFWYLFDAKYRFDENPESDSNAFNVPQDAIGQLHRYRDAILHTKPTFTTYRSAIKNLGGIILYPYPLSEKEYEKNVFYKSIAQVNIGALPFLPSKSELVSELLNRMINKTLPEEHFERFIEMDNSEYIEYQNRWKEWVTIDVVPNDSHQKERIKLIEEKQLHYIPYVKNLNSKIYISKKILLRKSGTTTAYLCNIKSQEVLTDIELQKLGANWNHRKTKYVLFRLQNITKINTPEMITPINFRYATYEGLKRYLLDSVKNKKYFYITNPDAARLLDALIKEKIPCDLSWANDKSDPSLIKFKIGDREILSSDKFGSKCFKSNGSIITLHDLLRDLIL